jgi:effector-binding domain-containing protein
LYSPQFFEAHFGEIVAFIPVRSGSEPSGRIESFDAPAGHYPVAVHHGAFADLDRTYGALGAYVVEHARGAAGPIRENYVVTARDTDDPSRLQTEVCWPVTASPPPSSP